MTSTESKLRKSGSKGGRSKSPRKRLAAKKNLKKANEGRKLAKAIALLDHEIANNRLMRENAGENQKMIQVLDSALEIFLNERRRLVEQQKM